MRTPQLLTWAALVVALGSGAACNRADTDAQTSRAAADVRAAAQKAGDELSDAWLTTQIQAKYFADRDIKGRYIDVSTNDRVVTLEGYVPSEEARQRVVQIARNASGVREVQDRLLIGRAPQDANRTLPAETAPTSGRTEAPPAPAPSSEPANTSSVGQQIDDARITTTIQAKFFMSPVVKGRHIDVDSRGGVVTLRGEVGSEREREEALRVAREADGVQRVEDMLTVNAGAQ
jgi:osmotically-inducible protein OsmY